MCQSMGYEVVTTRSGEEGVKMALATKFDVILTDLAMPGLSGLEVARQIRRTYPSLPIILVTGWERTLDSAQIAAAGITDVLYKPFRIEQLTEVVKSAALAGK
jgi:CheY-like chemotaxis protein